jgi:hypothetical protein
LHLCKLVAHAVELGAGRRTLAVGARLGLELVLGVVDARTGARLRIVARSSNSLGKKCPLCPVDAVHVNAVLQDSHRGRPRRALQDGLDLASQPLRVLLTLRLDLLEGLRLHHKRELDALTRVSVAKALAVVKVAGAGPAPLLLVCEVARAPCPTAIRAQLKLARVTSL